MVLGEVDAVFETNTVQTTYDFQFENKDRPVSIDVDTDVVEITDISVDQITLESYGGWIVLVSLGLFTVGLFFSSVAAFWHLWKLEATHPITTPSEERTTFCCACRAQNPAMNQYCFNCGDSLNPVPSYKS
eukprot:TRINITY_DN6730_c0_g1_i3.p2 TRINITY_DN6730_c0_g1~~TRINITY_DN6730_c0_g1_i3.p2  ORF type:complete len:131 (+),score=27.89 TRINITY_DN6730_c0_g1_i3:558-950(+)